MQFDLENLNPGAWFDLVEGKPKDGRICLRVCNGKALEAIRAKTVKARVEYRGGQRFEYADIKEDLHSELVWDYCIVDWENIQDAEGNPIPCTRANKVKLMRGSILFSRVVSGALARLADDIQQRAENAAKN